MTKGKTDGFRRIGRRLTCGLPAVLAALMFTAGSVGAQPAPAIGHRVWAQWMPAGWFRGTVVREADLGLHIEFDDGDKADRPASLIAVDRAPEAGHVSVGTRVLASWADGRVYPGTVTAIDGERYDVLFDNRDRGTVGLEELRLMTVRLKPELTAKPGDRVWAQWRPNAWFPGRVGRAVDMGLHVEFDDGDKADLPVSLVVPDRNPAAASVTVGTRVLALWYDQRYYPGTVRGMEDQRYDILFDDGDVRNGLSVEQIRLINE